MFNVKKTFISLLISFAAIGINNTIICMEQSFNLDTYHCKSASVMPVYTYKDKLYVILTREAQGKDQKKGGKKYTFDDFSGGSDKGETNPLTSAAREFWEEGILQETLGWSKEETEDFVKNNMLYAIAYTKDKNPHNTQDREVRNVTYIVNFDAYASTLFAKFYSALDTEKDRYKKLKTRRRHQHTTEKDKIASVLWDDFKEASVNNKKTIWAAVKNPQTNTFEKKQIILRPFCSSKLRPFFLEKPYEQGNNDNVRYYHARLTEVYTFSTDECISSATEEI